MDQKRKKVKKQVRSSNFSSTGADLPDDILYLILEMLVSFYDIVRFSLVCKPWNSMALIQKEKLIPLINHQPPCLFVNSVYDGNVEKPKSSPDHKKSYKVKSRKQSLYNFKNDSEIVNFKLRIHCKYEHRECFGSSYGWLFYKEKRNCVIVLVNPFSGTVIRLPPISKSIVKIKDVKDFILSSDPCLGSFEVLATNDDDIIAHLKFGDEFWTYSEGWSAPSLYSFAFFENYILGVSRLGRIFYLCIDHYWNKLSRYEIPRDLNKVKLRNSSPKLSSFVKTTNGDLLMVHEYFDPLERYKIFKIEYYSNGAFHIFPIVNLDGHCLFLKTGPYRQCISVLASNYPGCRANSIYHSDSIQEVQNFVLCSWKEFNLEDKSLHTENKCFPISPAGSRIDRVFWMVPSIKL